MFKKPSDFPTKGTRIQHVQLTSICHETAERPPLHDSSVSLVPSGRQPGFQKFRSSSHLENSSSEQFSNLKALMFNPSSNESSMTPSWLASTHSPAALSVSLLPQEHQSFFRIFLADQKATIWYLFGSHQGWDETSSSLRTATNP